MMKLHEIANEIQQKTGIYTNERSIERIARALLTETDFWHIVDQSDEVVPVVAETLNFFIENQWLKKVDNRLELTDEGKALINQTWQITALPDYSCNACQGRGLDINRLPEDVIQTFMTIHQQRPPAIIDYDQGYITPECTLARVAFAHWKGDIDHREILVLGDDDLVSLALCLVGKPRAITVVEIDERLVEFIRTWAKRLDLPIEIQHFDLSQPLPDDYLHRFDTFLTDPPESLIAFRAFVGRGIASLKSPGCAGYFGFTRREATLNKWHQIQSYLIAQNVVVTDILHNYHEYVNWDYAPATRAWSLAPVKSQPDINWYRSSLYRIETLDGFSGEVDTEFDIRAFNDQEASTT